MGKCWRRRGNIHPWDTRDPWQTREEGNSNSWLKRSLIAVIIFALGYGVSVSETAPGRAMVDGLRYLLTVQPDFIYLRDRLAGYIPKSLDISVLKRVQSTLARPADPLMYMSRPVDGRVVSAFGWQVDPVLKQEVMREGIDMEAPEGTVVHAAAAGKVKMVTDSTNYGRMLIIEHSQDIETTYGWLGEILVKPEETVSQGQVIARMGKPALAGSSLLYFAVREKGKAVDPVVRIQGDLPVKEGK